MVGLSIVTSVLSEATLVQSGASLTASEYDLSAIVLSLT